MTRGGVRLCALAAACLAALACAAQLRRHAELAERATRLETVGVPDPELAFASPFEVDDLASDLRRLRVPIEAALADQGLRPVALPLDAERLAAKPGLRFERTLAGRAHERAGMALFGPLADDVPDDAVVYSLGTGVGRWAIGQNVDAFMLARVSTSGSDLELLLSLVDPVTGEVWWSGLGSGSARSGSGAIARELLEDLAEVRRASAAD